jgi:hypothetical protein
LNHSEPTFHELVTPRKVMFWEEGDASQRRAYLVPLSDRSRFVAFGMLDPQTVHFVARGSVQYHLEAFIARMKEDEVRVELTPQPPVPKALVMKYVSNPPIEVIVYTPPPPPGDQPLDGAEKLAMLWREGDATTRRAFVLPLGDDPSEFLAFGMIDPPGTVHFVVQGLVRDDLELFLSRMLRDDARVELCAQPPAVLTAHLEKYVPGYADKHWGLVTSSPMEPPVLSLKQLRT